MASNTASFKSGDQPKVHGEVQNDIELSNADMRLKNGILTIKAKKPVRITEIDEENKKKPKSSSDRQRSFSQRMKEAGYVREYVHKDIVRMAKDFESHEDFIAEIGRLRLRAEQAELSAELEKKRADAATVELEKLQSQRAPWWRFWR